MNIGQVAKETGLNAKTIRYYEQIHLLQPAKRAANGYRDYSEQDLETLRFLQRARNAGFNIEECRQLLNLHQDKTRQSQHVKALVLEKAEHVATQIKELKIMHRHLLQLASLCQADEEPNCAILEELSEQHDTQEDKRHA
ncbi:MAG: Cu(I)-responsive transcriptional regulator [Oleiphilus sp.]|nr:MAG: Cu(I)-responsive transcriptional regulator [Oleiphilus sp.]